MASHSKPRKRTTRRREHGAPGGAAAMPPPHVIVREVMVAANGALATGDPLDAEMFASHLVADLHEMRAAADDPDSPPVAVPMLELLRHARDAELLDESLALALAFRALSDDADEDLMAFADETIGHLRELGAKTPAFADALGAPDVVGVWRASDVWGDQDSLYLGFRYEGHDAHTLVVLIDHNLGSVIKDAFVAGDPQGVVDTWRASTEDDADPEFMQLVEVEVADVLGVLLVALAETEVALPTIESTDLRDVLLLLESRAAMIAEREIAAGHTDAIDDEPPAASELDDLNEGGLLKRFLASDELAAEPTSSKAAAFHVVDCVFGEVCGGVARFSPTVAEIVLLHHMPTVVPLHEREEVAGSAVATVRAWARFAARHSGLPQRALDETIESIEEMADELAQRMRLLGER